MSLKESAHDAAQIAALRPIALTASPSIPIAARCWRRTGRSCRCGPNRSRCCNFRGKRRPPLGSRRDHDGRLAGRVCLRRFITQVVHDIRRALGDEAQGPAPDRPAAGLPLRRRSVARGPCPALGPDGDAPRRPAARMTSSRYRRISVHRAGERPNRWPFADARAPAFDGARLRLRRLQQE